MTKYLTMTLKIFYCPLFYGGVLYIILYIMLYIMLQCNNVLYTLLQIVSKMFTSFSSTFYVEYSKYSQNFIFFSSFHVCIRAIPILETFMFSKSPFSWPKWYNLRLFLFCSLELQTQRELLTHGFHFIFTSCYSFFAQILHFSYHQ